MRTIRPLERPIPGAVVQLAWWFMSGTARRQKTPSTETRLLRSWTRAKRAQATHVQAPIGQAILWALYDWRPHWLEADLVHATAEVTRRIDAARLHTRQGKARLRAREYRQALNHALRGQRAKTAAINAIQEADRLLARSAAPDPIRPALAREIRARVFTDREQAAAGHYQAGRWWSSRDAYARWVADQEQARVAARTARLARRRASEARPVRTPVREATRTVSMGQLAALAAQMNGRRL